MSGFVGKERKAGYLLSNACNHTWVFKVIPLPFFLILIAGVCFQLRKGIDCTSYLDTWMAHNVISHARLSLFFQFSSFIFYYV